MDRHIIREGLVALLDVDVCEHGLSCGVCHWSYKGRTDRRSHISVRGIVYPLVALLKAVIQGHDTPTIITRKEYRLSYNHICEVGWCVNPHHVYLGTMSENQQDRGMTPDQIRETRKDWGTS